MSPSDEAPPSPITGPPPFPPDTHRSTSTFFRSLVWLSLAAFFVTLFILLIEFRWEIPATFGIPLTTTSTYEIHICGGILREGIGAVLAGLKPVLMLANATGAVISTCQDIQSGHGYRLSTYLRLSTPLKRTPVPCNLSGDQVEAHLNTIVEPCTELNITRLRQYGVFRDCNFLNVTKYLLHPRMCLQRTAPLVRQITKFKLKDNVKKDDVCVLRRGGDVEERIMNGQGNQWAIDESLTIPVLRRLSERGRRIVLVTETFVENEVRELYKPNSLSNREALSSAVSRLEPCRCTFIAAASSFAAAMMQITNPTYIIYMQNRTGFSFQTEPYKFEEYGESAYPITAGIERLTELCAP